MDAPDTLRAASLGHTDDAESQMRKALGLLGETPRHRPEPERSEPPARTGGTLSMFGGAHRRRFVQDGDVPVTVLRREPGHEAGSPRVAAAAAAVPGNRLQRVEAALATETAAREKAERALQETQSALRDLQTKIGHAELARREAQDALRREQAAGAEAQAALTALNAELAAVREDLKARDKDAEEQQRALNEERRARKAAEKAQKAAEDALGEAERLITTLRELQVTASQTAPKPRKAAARSIAEVEPVVAGGDEPEPVKWWLDPPAAAKRR